MAIMFWQPQKGPKGVLYHFDFSSLCILVTNMPNESTKMWRGFLAFVVKVSFTTTLPQHFQTLAKILLSFYIRLLIHHIMLKKAKKTPHFLRA